MNSLRRADILLIRERETLDDILLCTASCLSLIYSKVGGSRCRSNGAVPKVVLNSKARDIPLVMLKAYAWGFIHIEVNYL